MTDDFKYKNFHHYPTATGRIMPSKRGDPLAVKLDTADDVSCSFCDFAKAFYQAANVIVNRMLNERNIDELDKYFFPVFFLYRHSIELLLKGIACTQIIDQIDRSTFFKNTFHDLEAILRYILGNTTLSLPVDEERWLLKYFHNVGVFDKASDSFRYPYHIVMDQDLNGNSTYLFLRVFEKQTHIDLITESNKMIAAYEILENWYNSISSRQGLSMAKEYQKCTSSFLDEGGNYYEQSVVGYEFHHNDFYAHCNGYLECANYLRQYMLEEDATGILMPHMIYPMCYLYRNDVELWLKAIIFEFSGMHLQEKCAALQKTNIRFQECFL